ncbi:STAS domain-containing protein [Streptomyces sp. GC420]|uniref:STAS domain-containing protein n=1 Tax=Streptomyces sp. GC420 TaxID=2697568 RepID=UPI001414DF19|nr:STAS domain-containing protein [Streptomyces sp. GC420]NBM15931.1 anti-sigma factor antagonist [Streptomyces sp. GC420]
MHNALHADLESISPESCRVRVSGELDVATTGEVRSILRTALRSYRHIVIDLGRLEFCDCSGLSALLAADRAARACGAELRLRAVPHSLARILRLTGVQGAFTVEP